MSVDSKAKIHTTDLEFHSIVYFAYMVMNLETIMIRWVDHYFILANETFSTKKGVCTDNFLLICCLLSILKTE